MHELSATINPTTAIIPINFLIISLLCSYKYNCKINQILQNKDLLRELDKWENEPIHSLPLRLKDYSKEERDFISEQVSCRQKAAKKLPTFCNNSCLFTKRSYEQSSSEVVAKYKSELFKGDLLVDLSGGLGVDDFYFCKSFNKVVSYDTDSYLNDIVKYNFQQLNINNHQRITQNANLVNFQEVQESATIYIDPDRRNENGKRQFLPENHHPNIYEILKKVRPKTRVLIKLSPMVDIELLRKNIETLNRIWVISHKYENKEILLECNTDNKKEIISVELNNTAQIIKSETGTIAPEINWEKQFLYIPSPSVIKADLCKELGYKFNLTSVNKSNRILFSNSNLVELPARKFNVLQGVSYKPKTLNKNLKTLNILKADILARDFFDNTAKLRKRHKISPGGEHFIVFTNNHKNEPLVFICEKT